MKKILLIVLFLLLFTPSVRSEIFVDYEPDNIKKTTSVPVTQKTNEAKTNKINVSEEKVPDLPAHLKNDVNLSGSAQQIAKRTGHEVKKSTNFELKINQNISDSTKKNTKIKFTTTKNQSAGIVTLPAGTVFTGHVVQSHKPMMTSNGGLLKIEIDEIIYQNISNETKAKVLNVNDKNIYFNTIKGQRKFVSNTKNNMKWGVKTCKKAYKTTSKLSRKGGLYWFITPIPAIYGTFVIGANAIYAPAAALFQKGGSVSLKNGSKFIIKLEQDTQIYVLDNL